MLCTHPPFSLQENRHEIDQFELFCWVITECRSDIGVEHFQQCITLLYVVSCMVLCPIIDKIVQSDY
ncbi:Uncharacterised protein [Vibrio cholerae]|nr:Uncharacterised protein [Vibrio cholerae]